MLKVEFHAMGCGMAAFVDNESPQATGALGQVPGWFEEWEQALSRFRPDSDLNRLNASAGQPYPAGPILWEVLRAALDAARWTGGLVAPTVLPALERAGYDRSFELIQSASGHPLPANAPYRDDAPTPSPLAQHPLWAPPRAGEGEGEGPTSWEEIVMNPGGRRVTLPPGCKIDLGGIAKGWCAMEAMRRLEAYGPALVDASGDLACSGTMSTGFPWPVDIDDPLNLQERLDQLALDRCGVATSGIDFRRWRQGDAWRHHIIDPRSGLPAETDLLTVTTVAPDAVQAEAAAKAVLILGSQAGLEWLEARPELGGLLAGPDGRVIYSSHMREYLWS